MFLLELLNPRPEPSDQSPLTFHKPWPSFGRVSLIQSLPSPRGFTNLLSTLDIELVMLLPSFMCSVHVLLQDLPRRNLALPSHLTEVFITSLLQFQLLLVPPSASALSESVPWTKLEPCSELASTVSLNYQPSKDRVTRASILTR